MNIFKKIKSIYSSGNDQKNKNQASQPNSQKKVLIVDDEQALLNALNLKFKSAGFATTTATNGQAALDIVKVNKPDIILLDLMMPIMDGKQMLEKLRQIPEFQKLPVIILTNAGSVQNMEETTKMDGAAAFLIKSNVSLDDILSKVKDLTSDNPINITLINNIQSP